LVGYVKQIVCLAHSVKNGGLCIAGREVLADGFGDWVRPVSSRPSEELTYLEYRFADGSGPQLLDVLEIGLDRPVPRGHQVENHLLDRAVKWRKLAEVSFDLLEWMAQEPETIWGDAEEHTSGGFLNCMRAEAAEREPASLYLLQVPDFSVWVGLGADGMKVFYGVFRWHGSLYKLKVTDSVVRDRFAGCGKGTHRLPEFRRTYVCVSLTKAWEGDGRCHKLIAAVLTDPPLKAEA
jgi:hypothetical protein